MKQILFLADNEFILRKLPGSDEMDGLPVVNPQLFTALGLGGSHHNGSKKVCGGAHAK
jgi:hypothetical protein